MKPKRSNEKIQPIRKEISRKDDIVVVDNLLSRMECQFLVERSEKMGYEVAPLGILATASLILSGNNRVKTERDNFRVLFDDEVLASFLWDRVRNFPPKQIHGWNPCAITKKFRFYKYAVGQMFKPHFVC